MRLIAGAFLLLVSTGVVSLVWPASVYAGLTAGSGVWATTPDAGAPGSGVVPDLMLTFEFGSSDLTPQSRAQLDQLGQALQINALRTFSFLVEGHASEDELDSLELSRLRAQSVITYLTQQHGTDSSRLKSQAYGHSNLRDPTNPHNAINRRVEFTTSDATVVHLKQNPETTLWKHRRVALIVGIGNYEVLPNLSNPSNDVKKVADKLNAVGFEVLYAIDVNAMEFNDLLLEFDSKLDTADLALVYYAGHGAEINGQNFMIPVDARSDGARWGMDRLIPLDRILSIINTRDITSLVFLDTCRSNPFDEKTDLLPDLATVPGLARVNAKPDTLIAYATEPGGLAFDGLGGGSPFTAALLRHMDAPALEVPQMLARVRRDVLEATNGQQVPWVADALLSPVYLGERPPDLATLAVTVPDPAVRTEVALGPALSTSLFTNEGILLNGNEVKAMVGHPQGHSIVFLGPRDLLRQGLNVLEEGKRRTLLWWGERRLDLFKEPYDDSSHAILVAIDDYDRSEDPRRRGPIKGFGELGVMRSSAERLKGTLVGLGFPEKNIVTLYDRDATSAAIDAAMREFYEGNSKAGARRLFVYFGGHGAGREGRGYLVTYDYDRDRPTTTSFLMSKLVHEHFVHIDAHHVLVALDACATGLALPGMRRLREQPDDRRLKTFARLALIYNDTQEPARNLVVAGTDDQEALYDERNGGIFTQALIDGLEGSADRNDDGLVRFQELEVYVGERVTVEAAKRAVRQTPSSMSATLYAKGNTLFILPPDFSIAAGQPELSDAYR